MEEKERLADSRHIGNGWEIPSEGYCDQPYVVRTGDGAWLCIMTTGSGHEGQSGQHVVSLRSTDRGKSWEAPVALEPADGPEASYAVLLRAPSGRIFAFYNHNTDNLRAVKADDPPYPDGRCPRVDSLGHFVFKYSDDHGCTWSEKRYDIPQRLMEIDRENADGGEVLYFWNVGKAFVREGAGCVSLHKVGGFGEGFFTRSEGVLLKSDNILTERDPARIEWETLPEGDSGLRTPAGGGPVAEEHSYSLLSDGSIYCVYRSIDGHPVCAYSRDGARSWSSPEYQTYADGRVMKHPRAANFAWRCENGKFLYWFHNHGGRFIREHPERRVLSYQDRNPVWLCGGVEADSPDGRVIQWSQPEIVLYDDDPYIRMSYPDLVEDGGQYFLTETQKEIARVHAVDADLLAGLWRQFDAEQQVARDGILLELEGDLPEDTQMPALPVFSQRDPRPPFGTEDLRRGFSVELWVVFDALAEGQVLLDGRTENGQGMSLRTSGHGTVEITLDDGRTRNRWDCDPGMLEPDRLHHVVVTVDAGPKIITFVVDGKLCDGGDCRQFGWGRFSRDLRHANGSTAVRVGPSLKGEIRCLRIYGRAPRTSEVVGNFRAGC